MITLRFFDNAAQVLTAFATSGSKEFASDSTRVPLMRFAFLPDVLMMVANGTRVLADYFPDMKPRTPTLVGDSCGTFKKGNKTPSGDNGTAFQLEHANVKDCGKAKRNLLW